LRDIVLQWRGKSIQQRFEPPSGAVTKHIRFVWVVKRKSSIAWFADQLNDVVRDVETLRNEGKDVSVEISIYVTCDDSITDSQSESTNEKGAVEQTNLSTSTSRDEKKEDINMVENVVSRKSSSSDTGGCCCTRVIADEDAITSPCNCASKNKQAQKGGCSSGADSFTAEKPISLVVPEIPLLSGRPHVANIIRKQAELAWGEMAVVVCGPKALIQCTRNAAANISDDRAVHKGTGAQGIYVHAECFGYA
jgi:hypothetical protein